MKKLVRLPEVKEITGLSRSSIYLKISQGLFPKPILLGQRSVGWIETEISEWVNERIIKSRQINSNGVEK